MKRKSSLLLLSSLILAGLASCGPKASSEPLPSEKPSEESSSSVEAPKSPLSKASFTYEADFQVDINANGGSTNMDGFKRHQSWRVVGELDLTPGDLYLSVAAKGYDLRNDKVEEKSAVLYAEGGKYYYQTSSEAKTEIADEASAYAKLGELLKKTTNNQTGAIDLGTFYYEDADVYQWANFGNYSTTIGPRLGYEYDEIPFDLANEQVKPDVEKEKNGVVSVTRSPKYIGYQTDAGISDFTNALGEEAATIEVKYAKDSKLVASYAETLNAPRLDMPIMTPAPTVMLSGTRAFSATYPETIAHSSALKALDTEGKAPITKKLSNHASGMTLGWISYGQFSQDHLIHEIPMEGITPGADIFLIAQTSAMSFETGYEFGSVLANGAAMSQFGPGVYGFSVKTATPITVELVGRKTPANNEVDVSVSVDSGILDYELKVLDGTDYAGMVDIKLDKSCEAKAGRFVCFKPTKFAEGKEIASVKAGETDLPNYGGYYCAKADVAGKIAIVALTQNKSQEKATFVFQTDEHVTATKFGWTISGDFSWKELPEEGIEPGATIFLVANTALFTYAEGYTLDTITMDGTALKALQGPIYGIAVPTAGEHQVVVSAKLAA
ncbi:MAG: hypothetical protein SOV58_04670 [Candidatus Enteromonas sp.]|nr:hypothetical protein [Candidatus Enteromonas sp.]